MRDTAIRLLVAAVQEMTREIAGLRADLADQRHISAEAAKRMEKSNGR